MTRILLSLIFSVSTLVGKSQMVYEVSTPFFADVKYSLVQSPIFADVVVYKAPNPSYSGIKENRGVWYFCPNRSMANLTVCKTDEIQADLKVYFTDSSVFAKWNNTQKKKQMDPQSYQN